MIELAVNYRYCVDSFLRIMNKKITINNQEINYRLRRHKRAKRLRLAVYCDARVVVTKPWWVTIKQAENFIVEKADWIIRRINHFKASDNGIKRTKNDYLLNKNKALRLAIEKIEYFNRIYKFSFNKIFIKNQITRWGSCSSRGNLNFNYRIVHLEDGLLDYIIVHELCHLREMNHSKDFWNLVEYTIPDYTERRKKLRTLL